MQGGDGIRAEELETSQGKTCNSLYTSRKYEFTISQAREAGNSSCPCFEERK